MTPVARSFLEYDAVALLSLTGYERYAACTGVAAETARLARRVAQGCEAQDVGETIELLPLLRQEFSRHNLDPAVAHLTVLIRARLWPWTLPLRRLAETGRLSDESVIPAIVRNTLQDLETELAMVDGLRTRTADDLDRTVLSWFGRGRAVRALRQASWEYSLRQFFGLSGAGRTEAAASAIAFARREVMIVGLPWNLPDPAATKDEGQLLITSRDLQL